MPRLLLIDNYDSFTYNLAALLKATPGVALTVRRNDAVSAADLDAASGLVLSPGPGLPAEAGDLMAILAERAERLPVLGVCLGLQALAERFGARLENLARVYHGVATDVQVVDPACPLFRGVPEVFAAGRYHSWAVSPEGLPPDLAVTAIDGHGRIMALRHRRLPLYAVQFHPESVLTPEGPRLLENFVHLVAGSPRAAAA